SLTGKSPTRAGHHHFAVCPLGLYKAKDQYICIIALDHQWPSLCDAMGRPDLVTDERYKTNAIRCTRVQEVVGIVQGWVDSLPSAEAVLAALEKHRVPCAPVLTIEQVVNHPHMIERGTVRQVQDSKLGEFSVPGMPLRFSGFPNNIPLEAAYTGQHNEQVLSEMLGYDAGRIAALRESGVLHENTDT
nr:CoA transferase [Gammaproteobacteria bacterium]